MHTNSLMIAGAIALAGVGTAVAVSYWRVKRVTFHIKSIGQLSLHANIAPIIAPFVDARYELQLSDSGSSAKAVPASELVQLVKKESLVLSGLSLAVVPPVLCTFKTLQRLDLSNNRIANLPDAISSLQGLTDLDLGHNQLVSLPASIGSLRSLRFLNLMANSLTFLPSELGNLRALYRLGLKGNKLTELPRTIGGLTSLVELFITDNLLVTLPAEIGRCTSLVKVQASFNRLAALPAELGRLQKLELLRIACNNLSEVGDWLQFAFTINPLTAAGVRGVHAYAYSVVTVMRCHVLQCLKRPCLCTTDPQRVGELQRASVDVHSRQSRLPTGAGAGPDRRCDYRPAAAGCCTGRGRLW